MELTSSMKNIKRRNQLNLYQIPEGIDNIAEIRKCQSRKMNKYEGGRSKKCDQNK